MSLTVSRIVTIHYFEYLVLDAINSDTFYYTKVVYIYYDSMFIEFSMTDETYNSDFFEHFSMQ